MKYYPTEGESYFIVSNEDIGPAKKFEKELASVFVRWWEESDLEDHEMAVIALQVTDRFCSTDIEFEADFGFEEE